MKGDGADCSHVVEVVGKSTAAASLNTAAFGPMEGDINAANVNLLMDGENILVI